MYRKNVAGQFVHFQGVDATTAGIKSGVTWTIRRCIDGTFAAGGGTVTEDGTTGWYKCALSQADTNGNNIGFNFTGSGAVPQTVNIVTTAADPTDAVRLGLTALPNVTVGTSGGLPTLDAALNVSSLQVDTGTAQAGTANTITLRAGASAIDDTFKGAVLTIYGGTGLGQTRAIIGYVGSTKVVTVARNWATNPDATSFYKIHGLAVPKVDDNLGVIIQAGTGTGQLDFTAGVIKANAVQIGGVTQTGGDLYPAVTNIAVTGAALNKIAASLLLTTGTDTGGVANTNTLDGVFDNWADAAGTIDGYYQFDVSATTGAVAVGATWDGYLVGVVNTLKVYAFNWGAAGWDQIGTVVGIAGTVTMSQEWDLTSAHTGTGGNLGLVRIRFNASGLTAATLKTDRILLGYAVVLTPPANWSLESIDGSGRVKCDVDTIKTNPVVNAGTVTFPTTATLASTTNITAGTITTATNLTNLPSIPANWLTAAGIAAGALNGKGDWLLASSYTAPLSQAATATAVWADAVASDFTAPASVGKSIMNGIALGTGLTVNSLTNLPSIPANWITAAGIAAAALNGKGDWLLSSGYTAPLNLSAAATAAAIWRDAVAADFTQANSIGLSVMNGIALGTGLTVNDLTTKTGFSLAAAGLNSALMSDLAGPPAANAKITDGLSWLFMSVQNDRKTTSTTDTIANSANAVVGTATVSDDGTTYEKTKYA